MAIADLGLILLYVLFLWLPGGVLGTLAGLRGWTLAAVAPLLTYAVAGLAGPWSDALGLRWSPLTFLGWFAVFAALAFGVRRFAGAGLARAPLWPWRAQAGVAACVAVAAVVSVYVVGHGMGGLSTIPQDWDAAWHANSVRWIADTGQGGLYAPSALNWYESPTGVFYPNAYHLVAAMVYQVSGASVVAVLNAHTALIPVLLALSVVALVRRFAGRAVVAGAGALLIVATGSIYDMLWRGPLLPFATGVALTPVAVVLVLDLLDTRAEHGPRAALRPGFVLAIAGAGLICVHSSTAFGVALFVLPMLVVRWWRDSGRLAGDAAALVVAGVAVGALASVELLAARGSGASVPPVDWKADLTASQAVGEILTWQHAQPFPQWWLGILLVAGLVTFRKLGDLRWLGAVAVVFGALFVAAAAYDTPWANAITRPWWNDRWRLIALTAVPLCVIAAHGLGETQRAVAGLVSKLAARVRFDAPVAGTRLAAAGVVLVVLGLSTGGLYLGRNEERMGYNTGDGMAVSRGEIAGYEELARIVPPGERVLNDRGDGSVWMYALAGVRPVAGHYDGTLTGPDATLLAERFNRYDSDEDVRAAVRRLHVGYVIVGKGFLRSWSERQPGLTRLDDVDVLEQVYRNRDVTIYKINDTADNPDLG